MNYSHVLRIRAFRDLWLGQTISQLGDAFYYIVFMFMAKKITGRDEMVGAVGALETIPYLIFSAYAGVAADRFDRRKLMLWSDLGSAVALALFAGVLLTVKTPPIWALLAMPFLLSTMRCFFMPAKSAAVPALVPDNALQMANSLSMTTQNIAPLIGLALTGSVLGLLWTVSPHWFFFLCVALNTVSFLGSAWFVARLPVLHAEGNAKEQHPWSDFKDGLRYISGRPDLKTFIALIAGFRLGVAPFFIAYLAANDAWFGGKPTTIVWMEFSFFVGMILASPFVGKLKVERPGLWFSTGLLVISLMVGGMAFCRNVPLFIALNIVCGLAVPPADIPINTWLQKSVPDAFRGRVNAVTSMIGNGAMPIGMAAGGILVRKLGVSGGFLVMGAVMALACAIGFLSPAFREARMEDRPDQPTEDPTRELAGVA